MNTQQFEQSVFISYAWGGESEDIVNQIDEEGDLDSASQDFETALKINPELPEQLYNRGKESSDNGDADGAIQDYIDAIRLNPKFASAYYGRARLWEEKKEYSSAIVDYQKYLELYGAKRDGDQKEVEEKIKKLKSN